MKTVFFAALSLLLPLAAEAADTAYSALRIVGKVSGKDALDRVVELRGRSGAPQPEVWKIVLDDPRSRGGIREMEVQSGRIIGERAPTSRALGRPMDFNQLNLDSEGAFTVANQEAQKAGVAFERVDYTLKSGTGGGAPVWNLQLLDARGAPVGSIQIAADNGAILRKDGLVSRGPAYPRAPRTGRPSDDRDYLNEPADRTPPRSADRGYDGDDERYRDDGYDRPRESTGTGLPGFLRRVGRHFDRRGRQVENFFTGRSDPVD